jgi:hypothetical protein
MTQRTQISDGERLSASSVSSAVLFWHRRDSAEELLLSPHSEAAPIVFARRSHLIGEAKVVGPSFLFGAPTAAPDEIEDARLTRGSNANGADEIRASGLPVEREMLDIELGMIRQHLLDETGDLDARGMTANMEPLRRPRLEKAQKIGLERVRSA